MGLHVYRNERGINIMYSYKKIRKYSSDIHVFEFNPEEFRFDTTIGIYKKLEKLSKIAGEPKTDEYVVAKMNGGFFDMRGSSEFIGSYVDEGAYYNSSMYYYPTMIFWKNNKITFEMNPTQSRHVAYQTDAHFAIGIPWTLVVNGEINYTFSIETLKKVFGHPTTKNPRTLIGQKSDGTIVWVVVDGRRSTSAGVTIYQSAELMKSLGCFTAANLDGGGSSEMIVNNAIVNKPSDGAERSIGTAFVAYAKKNKITENSNPQKKAVVTAWGLNVRSGPSAGYKSLSVFTKNTTVYVISVSNGWAKIVYGNDVAYVSSNYIKYV